MPKDYWNNLEALGLYIMLSIQDRTLWVNAELKARSVKPHVAPSSIFGEYTVTGSKDSKYTVEFFKDNNHWYASCTCKAHVGDYSKAYKPKACYHIPAAYNLHRIIVAIRKDVRANQVALAAA